MGLYKRGGVYWSYIYIEGVRHARTTGTANRRQAELLDQRFKDELNLNRHGVSELAPQMIFAEFTARFLAEGVPKAWHVDRLKMLLPYWADIPIGRINKAKARDYREARRRAKPVSHTTVNRDLECLRHLLFWAVDEGLLAANPLSRVRMVRERRIPRLMVNATEEAQLLAQAAPHLHPLIITALDTGMRRGELLNQRFEHVDFTRRILYVTKSKTAEGEAREIPLTGRVFDLLSKIAAEPLQPNGVIFTFKGKPITRIKTGWKAALRRAELRYFRFHDLRHTFNTRLMEAGVMQEVRKALMGHSSGEDVHAIYTHVELPQKREAIRKLEAWQASPERLASHALPETQEAQPELKKGEVEIQ